MTVRFSANLTMLFNELPFLDRFNAAFAAGFDAVEFLFPYEESIDAIKSRLDDLGLALALFNIHAGDQTSGEWGTLSNPNRQDYFRWSFTTALDAAVRLNCRRLNTMFGQKIVGIAPEKQVACAVENLAWAAPQAAEAGVTLLIEPLNPTDFPSYFIQNTASALRIIEAANHPNVMLQYDVYHAQMAEGNIINTIKRCVHQIGHIQIADVPGRHEPGTGEINYPAIFAALEQMNYQGYIGLEYRPSGDTLASLGWLREAGRR